MELSDCISQASAASTASSTNAKQILKIVNAVFSTNGRPVAKSLAADFADGSKYKILTNNFRTFC